MNVFTFWSFFLVNTKPLCWPRQVQSSIRVAKESWGLLSSDCRVNRPHLGLCPEANVPLQGRQGPFVQLTLLAAYAFGVGMLHAQGVVGAVWLVVGVLAVLNFGKVIAYRNYR